jgi:hypothetical protein
VTEILRPRSHLTSEQATKYAAAISALKRWRVTHFGIGMGIATIEIRPLPGTRPQAPALTLRTVAECEQLLREARS